MKEFTFDCECKKSRTVISLKAGEDFEIDCDKCGQTTIGHEHEGGLVVDEVFKIVE